MDALIVRPDHFLRFAAPDVICGVEIFVGAHRDAIEHEKLFRAE
jgi:hypothetical protein